MELRAFPGKVDTGFPIGNATSIESRALSGHDPCNFRVNLIGKRSRGATERSNGASTLRPSGEEATRDRRGPLPLMLGEQGGRIP
jgi:hypothetical protein